jgi:hypothetical protein
MDMPASEATEALLEAMGTDFQRQLARSGTLERLFVREWRGIVTLVATVRVAEREVQLLGTGENLLTAYADLTRRAPEPILVSAFDQLVDAWGRR